MTEEEPSPVQEIERKKMCKDGIKCNKIASKECQYSHECGFGNECDRKEKCIYSHVENGYIRSSENTDIQEAEKIKKMCWNGKKCREINKKCRFDHNCTHQERCNKKEKCKYLHVEDEKGEGKNINNTEDNIDELQECKTHGPDKKKIQCRYYKNCREGSSCKFEHPTTTNKNSSKNVMEGMLETMHSLTQEMKEIKEMKEEIKEMKTAMHLIQRKAERE